MTNLRWIMRDGEKVLQSLSLVAKDNGRKFLGFKKLDFSYKWVDIPCLPLEEEQVTG